MAHACAEISIILNWPSRNFELKSGELLVPLSGLYVRLNRRVCHYFLTRILGTPVQAPLGQPSVIFLYTTRFSLIQFLWQTLKVDYKHCLQCFAILTRKSLIWVKWFHTDHIFTVVYTWATAPHWFFSNYFPSSSYMGVSTTQFSTNLFWKVFLVFPTCATGSICKLLPFWTKPIF